ncbi:MAG: sulfotransferase [Methylococcaceae bacterium]|nr:sulfotransferase [Methylococcaceae bacterium]
MEKNKFIIGIGSQRAGSTLLHRILEQCSPIYMNPVKELHYFDTLYGVRHPNVLHKFSTNQLNAEITRIVNAKNFGFLNQRFKNSLRTNFLLSTKKIQDIQYIDLFRPCVAENAFLGEITPEYMILPKEGIKKMRETIGANAKIILLARNPVKRFISAFKLLMYGHGADMSRFEEQLLSSVSAKSEWMNVQDSFNDYETALINYQQEFEHVLMLSYDSLFCNAEKTAEKITEFLGIPLEVDTYKTIIATKVNSLEETMSVSESSVKLLEKRYLKNQAYLDSFFGKGSVTY